VRLAFLLKLPCLAAADPDGSCSSWQWRGNAFSLVLNTGCTADPLCLLPGVRPWSLLRPSKRCLQGTRVAHCLLFGGGWWCTEWSSLVWWVAPETRVTC